MTSRLVERLSQGGYKLRLLAPDRAGRGELESIHSFRAGVYREFASMPPEDAESSDDADRNAWHLLAYREETIVGCIRLVMFLPEEAETVPRRVLANSQCQFCEPDKARCLAALADYVADWRAAGGPFVQVGGLAVASSTRRIGVGAALCLCSNAFMRLMGSAAGAVFAAEKTGGSVLYEKAGCFPLAGLAGPLGLLDDSYHRDRILVMGSAPRANAPELEPEIIAMCGLLDEQLALHGTAHPRSAMVACQLVDDGDGKKMYAHNS